MIFAGGVYVSENTSQAASVEFVRHGRANYARSRLQAFCRKNPEGFSTVSRGRRPDRLSAPCWIYAAFHTFASSMVLGTTMVPSLMAATAALYFSITSAGI